MELTGKIIHAGEPRGGQSQRTGNPWKSQDFVVETHEQYPKKCVFTVFGEDRLRQFNIKVGDEVTVSFDIDAHEWNGRWFNDIRAWNVAHVDPNAVTAGAQPVSAPAASAVAAPVAPAVPSPSAPQGGANAAVAGAADDLPF